MNNYKRTHQENWVKCQKFTKTTKCPLKYADGRDFSENIQIDVLSTNEFFETDNERNSWSSEIEEIHKEPTKTEWIDVYKRQRVIHMLSNLFQNTEKKKANKNSGVWSKLRLYDR